MLGSGGGGGPKTSRGRKRNTSVKGKGKAIVAPSTPSSDSDEGHPKKRVKPRKDEENAEDAIVAPGRRVRSLCRKP